MKPSQIFLSKLIYAKIISSLRLLTIQPKLISTHNLENQSLAKIQSLYPGAEVVNQLKSDQPCCDLLIMNLSFLHYADLPQLFKDAYRALKDKGFLVIATMDFASKQILKKYAGYLMNYVLVDNLSILKALNHNPGLSSIFIEEPIMAMGSNNEWLCCDIFFIYKNPNSVNQESYSALQDENLIEEKPSEDKYLDELTKFEFESFEENRELHKMTAEERMSYVKL